MIHRALPRWVLIVLGLFVVCIVAVFVAAIPPLWPLEIRQAKQRWARQQIHHYEVDVVWADGWRFGHARVEMRDGQLVSATDLDTGQPIEASKRSAASYFASIDRLFTLVEQRAWPSLDWRIVVSRFSPALERWLQPCVPPLESVTFDDHLGYPQEIGYNDSWCNETSFFIYSKVQLSNFKVLP